jgi:hypothetical protein
MKGQYVTLLLYQLTTRWWGSPPTGPPGERALAPMDLQMVGQRTYRTTRRLLRRVGCMSVWYCTSWPPDGRAVHLQDHQESGKYVSLVSVDHQMVGQCTYRTTRRLLRRVGCISVWYCTSWPPDGRAVHLQDHQASGKYVSLVSVDHQMVGQCTYRTTRWVGTGKYVSLVLVDHQMVCSAPTGPPDEWALASMSV